MNDLIKNITKAECLANYIENLEYGEVITHQKIENIIECKYGNQRYNSIVSKAKWLLLEKEKFIENIRGQGYRVVEPDKYTDESIKYLKKGFNEISKSDKIQKYAPVDLMSMQQAQVHRNVSDRLSVLKAHVYGAKAEIKLLKKQEA